MFSFLKKRFVGVSSAIGLVAVALALSGAPAQAVTNNTVSCTNQGDTYVSKAEPNSNKSANSRMRLDRDGTGPTMLALIKIDCVIPSGTSPVATAVRGTADSTNTSVGADVLRSRLVKPFNPTTVTWNTKPADLTGASEDSSFFGTATRTTPTVPAQTVTIKTLNGAVDGSTVTLPAVAVGHNVFYFQYELASGTTQVAGIPWDGAGGLNGGYAAPAFSLDYQTA